MAKIIRFGRLSGVSEWTSAAPMGKLVRHVAFGYTLAVNGASGSASSPQPGPLKRMR